MDKIGIIDYGCGNLASLTSAIKRLRGNFIVSNQVNDLEKCDKFILPGVGAYPYAMKMLRNLSLDRFLKEKAKNNFPILGICLGMQLLFESSDEFGGSDGLGILKGVVKKLPENFPTIPNIGWWGLKIEENIGRFELINDDTFYFVHSFYCIPDDVEVNYSIDFNNHEICAMVKKENIIAVQFHPEKSQKSGEKILRDFIN